MIEPVFLATHVRAIKNGALPMYTVYSNPKDFAGKVVVRMHVVSATGSRATGLHVVCDTVDQAREYIPPGLVCMTRSPEDEPPIVETWF